MWCFARVPCDFTEVFWEGRSNYYSSSFYLICKPTASALENAVNKVTLGFCSFLAMLAKIGVLFTREILFVLLSIGCVATTLEWCLILCLWFSIENVKPCHIADEDPTGLKHLSDQADSHLLITTYWHITYCHFCIYFGTFDVNARDWKGTDMRGASLVLQVCLSLVGMKIDLVYANECCRNLLMNISLKSPKGLKPMSNLTIAEVDEHLDRTHHWP